MIDLLDKQILEFLTKDARVAFKDIAEKLGVSRAAVHQHVERMKKSGVISGTGYQVNPESLGYDTCTFIGVTLSQGIKFSSVSEDLMKIPEVVECHYTTGAYALILRLYCRNNADLMRLLDAICHIDGVSNTETLISLHQSFSRAIPLHLTETPDNKRRRGNKAASEE